MNVNKSTCGVERMAAYKEQRRGGSNIDRRGSGSRVGHLGLPAQTGSGRSLGGKPWKTHPWRGQLPIHNHLLKLSPHNIGVISPTTLVLHPMPLGVVPHAIGVASHRRWASMQAREAGAAG